MTATVHDAEVDLRPTIEGVPEEIRWATGSTLLGLFSVALFDQAALPEVSAALARTGRIREDPLGRAARTAASEQILTWGTNEDRAVEAERLKSLHRAVRGVDDAGRHYSALSPDLWMFIMASTIMMTRNGVATLLSRELTASEDEALYQYLRHDLEPLSLGRSAQLPGTWPGLVDWYEHMLPRLESTESLRDALHGVRRPSVPPFLPAPARPAWSLASPILGRALIVLGLGVMHPDARRAMPITWGTVEELQFKILSGFAGLAYRHLPKRFTLSPLAYNRRRYEHIIKDYRAAGLVSFASADSP